MQIGKSSEDYLEAILVIQQKKGYVRSVDIAHYMNVSKPSVTRAIHELSKMDCAKKQEDGYIILTDQGRTIAEQIYERHCFFRKHLLAAGVDPETADQEACSMEHGISSESFQKLKDATEI